MTITQAAEADTTQGPFYADADAAEAFGRRLLIAHGLPEEDASTVARCLVRADLRGVDTHGLQLLPHYLERVRRGLINPRPDLKVERVTPMVGALDGQDAFGFVVATKAMAEAIGMAAEFGVGIGAAQHAFRHGRQLRAAGNGRRLYRHRFHQRIEGDTAVGRPRRPARHQPD